MSTWETRFFGTIRVFFPKKPSAGSGPFGPLIIITGFFFHGMEAPRAGTIVCGIAAIHCVAGAVRIPQLRRPFWDVIHDGGFNAVGLSSVCFQPNFCPASPSVCGPRCVHAGSDCFGLVPTERAIVGDDGRSDEHVSSLGRSISTRAARLLRSL